MPAPGPLSYSWSASAGSFNNPNIANPVFIPPDVTGGPQNITVTLTVSDGEDTDVDSLTITVSDATAANLPPSISDLGAPGFHRYTLSLAYSPRFSSPADTNNVEVWFDGQLLSTLSGTVAGWQTFGFDVQPGGDSAQIELRGAGTSDGAGGYVDAVALHLTGTAEASRVVNGSFETHPPLTNGGGRWNVFNSIDGWTATVDQIEVQSNLVSPAAFDGNAKVEMDAAVNATIVQTVATAEATMLDSETATLNATANDPDAGPSALSYSWSASAGSFDDPSAATPVFTPPNVGADTTVTVTLTVSDGEDTDSRSFDIVVRDSGGAPPPNQPPVIGAMGADPASISDIQTSQLTASATDPDAGPSPLSYSWSASAGTFNNPTIANPVFIPPDVTGAPQNITVTLTVSDGEDTDTDSLTITVSDTFTPNLPPSITDLGAPGFHRYTLSLTYSPRFSSPADTNNVEVWFDGQLLSTLSGTVAGWQTFDFDVQPGGDSAQIELRGAGTSDGAGGYVDAVALHLTGTAEASRVVNGSFETHPPLTNGGGRWNVFNNIDGWTATVDQIEVQSNLVSPAAHDGNAKVEMDATVNAAIAQTVATAEATMLDNETATLDATANDPDAGPSALSYSWSASAGSFNDTTAAAPVFTPPDVATDTTVTISLTVSDGEDSDTRSFGMVVRDSAGS